MNLNLHIHRDAAELDRALARFVANGLRTGIQERHAASLIVSGGRTPAGFFRCLSEEELDWARVCVSLADERWVDKDSAYSNARSVKEHLLVGRASKACFIPLNEPAATPEASAAKRNLALQGLPETFDVVVLGMGEDGHTASLFPDSPQLPAALYDVTQNACIAVRGKAPVAERITLTARRLTACRTLILHITGEKKWQVLGQALHAPDAALPIGLILNTQRSESKHVFWTP